jgi:hypothetical protein
MSLGTQVYRWLSITLLVLLAVVILAAGWPGRFAAGDCVWARSAKAWVDQNRNGTWDNTERPLPDVQFFVDDVRNELADVAQSTISDGRGAAVVRVLLPDCRNTRFEIYARPPESYESTTKARMPGRGTGPFLFGFAARNSRDG